LITKQLQLFQYEITSFEHKKNYSLDPHILEENWLLSLKGFHNDLLLGDSAYNAYWLMARQAILLPFRSIAYVMSAIMAFYCLTHQIEIPFSSYMAQDLQHFMDSLRLPKPMDLILEVQGEIARIEA
jgi:oligoendopeptidase F